MLIYLQMIESAEDKTVFKTKQRKGILKCQTVDLSTMIQIST